MNDTTFDRRRRGWFLAVIAASALAAAGAFIVMTPPGSTASALASQPNSGPTFAGPVSFADVVARVSPAVVNISVEKVSAAMPTQLPGFGAPGSPFDEFFGRFFGGPGFPNQPKERHSQALGSGFIIDPDGYVVTNNHVVSDSDGVIVILDSGEELDANIIGTDEKTDLALLKVDADRALPYVEFGDSETARVGDWVLAIGNPFGLGGSATAGIISARGRDIQSGPYDDYLQIDAPINSGNSGGPVFNAAGQVIGINTAIYSPNGGNIGIGFAIPARQAVNVVDSLREHGAVTRGWLGVQIQSLDSDLAAALGADDGRGALVAEVFAGSPADRAGIEAGDVIRQFDGQAVEDQRHLSRLVGTARPGKSVDVEVLRDGKRRTVEVRLGDQDESSPTLSDRSDGGSQDAHGAPAGLTLQELTPSQRAALELPVGTSGVLVAAVESDSAAAKKGIQPGDVITEINQRAVGSVSDAVEALDDSKNERALLVVQRGEQKRYVALALS
jgi:serine protease Do